MTKLWDGFVNLSVVWVLGPLFCNHCSSNLSKLNNSDKKVFFLQTNLNNDCAHCERTWTPKVFTFSHSCARLVTWTVGERKSAPRLAVELRGLQPLQGEMREMAALNKEGQGAGQVTPSSENLRAGTSVQEEESPRFLLPTTCTAPSGRPALNRPGPKYRHV